MMLTFAGNDVAADLAAYLSRLLRYDKAAAVRLVTLEATAVVWGQPPFDVLSMKGFPVVGTPPKLDLTLSAGELLEAIPRDGDLVSLPQPLTSATAWRGFLPPVQGWDWSGTVPLIELETAAVAGIAEFKERAEAIPDTERTRAVVDALAGEIWDRRMAFGPLRVAHAARGMGFLGSALAGTASVGTRGKWRRVDLPYGSIVLRDDRSGL
jgi:hypothetical protein